jgi:hypothetical protein
MNAPVGTCAFAILVLGCLGLLSPRGWAEEKPKSEEQLLELPLEELLDTEVTTPSRRPQEVREVPVTTYVVTEEDFRIYGYRDLKDVLRNLPGIEYVYPHSHLSAGGSWSPVSALPWHPLGARPRCTAIPLLGRAHPS